MAKNPPMSFAAPMTMAPTRKPVPVRVTTPTMMPTQAAAAPMAMVPRAPEASASSNARGPKSVSGSGAPVALDCARAMPFCSTPTTTQAMIA